MKSPGGISSSELKSSLQSLRLYIEAEDFKGYDPYDTLTSALPIKKLGQWIPVIATQIQKRNPVNIRPLLGIKKAYNPKGMGLLLNAYVLMQEIFPDEDFSNQTGFLFNWLRENPSKPFKGACWGYNFPWAGPGKYLPAYAPTVVASGFVARGIYAYYLQSANEKAAELLLSISKFVREDIPRTEFESGVCFSYSPFMKDCCYNASLLAAEILARAFSVSRDAGLKELACSAVDFVVSKQHEDGHWNYKIDPESGKERVQIDFHQGYVLDSIRIIAGLTGTQSEKWNAALIKGTDFYRKEQFFPEGRSLWRLPKVYPVEIHNQSQGIITFSHSEQVSDELISFAGTIAQWTINHMQDKGRGYFYYRKYKYFTNRLSFMRWSNAWMMLALSELIIARERKGPDANA